MKTIVRTRSRKLFPMLFYAHEGMHHPFAKRCGSVNLNRDSCFCMPWLVPFLGSYGCLLCLRRPRTTIYGSTRGSRRFVFPRDKDPAPKLPSSPQRSTTHAMDDLARPATPLSHRMQGPAESFVRAISSMTLRVFQTPRRRVANAAVVSGALEARICD